jgi:spermidine synthase
MFSRTRLVALLLFGSGFCALLYQTTWLREFRLVFGASTAATAAVLGVFMAGLGFGGIILGRRSETKARPLAFYAKLELLIALSAALSPLLILAARHFYIALGGTQAMGIGVGTIVRLILTALIIGTPTFLMGGTLPAAARAVVAPDDITRRSIGILYGTNTLGAVTGSLAGTFYCFENFGNRATLWLATALNIVVALSAFYLARTMADGKIASKPSREKEKEESHIQVRPWFVFSAAALVGFAFFLMELVWYRTLGPLLGGSTFSFGLILAMALLGIGIGGAAYAFLGLKRSASLHFFALTCAAEALFIAIPYALGDRLAMVAMLLRPLGTLGFYGHVIAWSALCAIVVFPAAFIAGLQFPLLIALLGKGRKNVGSQTGAAYAWNTVGALIGSLAGGFGLLPMFSAPGVWKIVVVLLCAVAVLAVLLALSERRHWSQLIPAFGIALLALVMLHATGPTAFWRHSQIGVGRIKQFQASPNEIRDLVHRMRRQILWETEGIESSVAVTKRDSLSFIVNGRSDGNAKYDAGTQIMCGLIPAALHPHPTKAMVVGLGTGSSAGWLAAVPTMERVDAVELEPAVVHVAQDCAAVNHDALRNPKLRVTLGDAREVLLTTREKYDIVVSEPSNPYRAGIAGLFTREYYRSVDRCLQPGGIFLQWVQAYEIDDRTLQIFYRTLGSVFSNIQSWQTTDGDLALLASHQPIRCNVEQLRARLKEEPFRRAMLAGWRAEGVEDFLAHYVGNEALAETLQRPASGPLNTDDRTVIEFAFARSVNLTGGFPLANLQASAQKTHNDRPRQVDGTVDWTRMQDARLSMSPLMNKAPQFQETMTPEQKSRAAAFVSYSDGDLPAALRHWRAQPDEPRTLPQIALLAESLAAEGNDSALGYIDKLSETLASDAEAIRSEFLWRTRRPQEAAEMLEKFFHDLRDDPWPPRELILRSLKRAESIATSDRSKVAALFLYNALRTPLGIFNNENDRMAMALAIAIYLDGDPPGNYTQELLHQYEPHVLWEQKFLEVRKDCYNAIHDPKAAQATRDFDEFMKHQAARADVTILTKDVETRSLQTNPATSSTPAEAQELRP